MKANLFLPIFLAVLLVAGTTHAGFISMLGEDGQVWNLNTGTGAATKTVKFADPGGSVEEQYSPNALGVSGGSYFYTTFNASGPDKLFRDGSNILSISTGEPYNIGNGDAVGSNFYFVDRMNGEFVTVSNIFTSPTSDIPGVQITGYGGDTMGDIAVKGTTAYLSTNATLATIDINNPGDGFIQSLGNVRFVGLGFDGDSLYGVRREGANNFDLYSINTATLVVAKLFDITGLDTTGGAVSGQYEITDASVVVPIPGAVWLLASGLVGLVGLRKRFQN